MDDEGAGGDGHRAGPGAASLDDAFLDSDDSFTRDERKKKKVIKKLLAKACRLIQEACQEAETCSLMFKLLNVVF